jgi:hypothetical protein
MDGWTYSMFLNLVVDGESSGVYEDVSSKKSLVIERLMMFGLYLRI